ncbi:MAG: hypothetical protein ACRBFS_15030 [Aureispira sp.]
MISLLPNSFPRILGLFITTLFVVALPSFAHAEAFKGGLLPSGAEKAIFFILLLIPLAIIAGIIATVKAVYKKEKGKKAAPDEPTQISTTSLVLLTFLGILLMALLGSC